MAATAGAKDPAYTIVEYMSSHSGYKCGYCKSKDTNFSHGMWAHRMSVGDYQALIDRGWRRSGKYCYKPTMDKTCCPMYTIKCDATTIKLSKSQKKVLKRMHRYLSHGDRKECTTPQMDSCCSVGENEEFVKPKSEVKCDISSFSLSKPLSPTKDCLRSDSSVPEEECVAAATASGDKTASPESISTSTAETDSLSINQDRKKVPSPSIGPDGSRPPCRKAKLIRRERREAKLARRAVEGESPMEAKRSKQCSQEKSLEDFLNEPLSANPAHKLEVRLVRSHPCSDEFVRTLKTAHSVYQKYQIDIHGDTAEKCNESQYQRFLCNSPLEAWQPGHSGPQLGYGSFHHQYWLDDTLIAVGVLDILPHCVSSVYLYYDPQYSFLSLGTYASLREVALVREIQQQVPALKWYYMGFYIHSCPKMRYKGNYKPSFLLCPETYEWFPIESAIPKLDKAKYSRLNDDPSAVDVCSSVDINKIPVLHDQMLVRYGDYKAMYSDDDEDDTLKEYASLVGGKSAYSLFLCLS